MSMSSINAVVGGILLYCSCSISSAGGIGGGGLNVPIFLVVFKYSYQQAVILSLCTVLGNYISQVYINWNKRHPYDPRRPLIYWDAVLMLLPAQLGGSNIGVIIAKVFPEGILIIIAMLVLMFAGFKSFRKGRKYWLEETSQRDNLRVGLLVTVPEEPEDLQDDNDDDDEGEEDNRGDYHLIGQDHVIINPTHITTTTSTHHTHTERVEANKVEDGDSQSNTNGIISRLDKDDTHPRVLKLPWISLGALTALWILYGCLYSVLSIAVRLCSPVYWSILAVSYVPLTGMLVWAMLHVSHKQAIHLDSILKGDLNMLHVTTRWSTVLPPLAAFIIGMLCTTLGIGGGELMGPLLLSLRGLPQVVSSTTSTMSFINTSSNLVHYAILGQIDVASFFTFFSIGALGGVSGRYFYQYVSKKYGRPSVTIFMLLSVLFASFWLLVYHLITEAVAYQELSPYCK